MGLGRRFPAGADPSKCASGDPEGCLSPAAALQQGFFGVVDFLAILPFHITLALPASLIDLRILRVLRLLRFARVLKLGRYYDSIGRMKRLIGARRSDLGVALAAVVAVGHWRW